MAQRGREVEAFTSFCAGLATVLLVWLALAGLNEVVSADGGWRAVGYVITGASGAAFTVGTYRWLHNRSPGDGSR
ncbi:hypothetical protein [Kitasatospora camelliae]|uniref:F0F1-ATPase subunit (Ca2+/Mg2+ transporter) n=1 Tax=Kitasatospora camelliae TaxID=3156397 RepID=A0AAU8JPD5_9ACTN